MAGIRPVRWAASNAASGLRDLPRNSAWLLSKALRSPVSATESAAHDTTDGLRRMTIAVADKLPGTPDSVGIKLKRAETAVARAKEAERQALAEARTASERADAAKVVSEDGKRRVHEATREGKQEVQRRTQEARERFARLVDQEREEAEKEVAYGSTGSPLM
jgi:colicin import membrane protein